MTNQCFTLILHPILVAVWPNDYFYASRIIDAILIKKYIVTVHDQKIKMLVGQIYKANLE